MLRKIILKIQNYQDLGQYFLFIFQMDIGTQQSFLCGYCQYFVFLIVLSYLEDSKYLHKYSLFTYYKISLYFSSLFTQEYLMQENFLCYQFQRFQLLLLRHQLYIFYFCIVGYYLLLMIILKRCFIKCLLILGVHSIINNPPSWESNPYVQAGGNLIVNSLVGNSTTPTATILFPGQPFTIIPNIGYGTYIYKSNDFLGSQMFQINKTSITTSSFSVLIQISGNNYIWMLAVRFIAIDKLFPYKLNSYDNLPVNYSAGPLTIFQAKEPFVKTYTNTINFTQLSNGMAYNYFGEPLTKNKVVFFLTSLFIAGTEQTSLPYNPITFNIDYSILTNQTFSIAQFGIFHICAKSKIQEFQTNH